MKKLINTFLVQARGNIARAFSTSLFGIFSGLFTSLVLLRAIVLEVDVSDFFTYAIALQLTAYLSVLQMGLDFAASREIAERLGAEDEIGANQAFWELHRFNRRMTALAALAVVLGASGLWLWGRFVGGDGNKVLMAQILFLSGLAQVLQSLARPYIAALVGSRRQPLVNVIQLLNSLITGFLAYGLLKLGMGVFCLPIAALLIWVITLTVFQRASTKHTPWRSPSACPPDKAAFKRIFKFGGLSTVGGVAWTVESTSDIFILGLATSPAVVAAYVVWWRIPQMLFDLCTRLAYSAFPDMAHRHSKGEEEIRALFSKVAWASLFLGSLACVGIGVWLPTFVGHWLGGMHKVANEHQIAIMMGVLVLFRVAANFMGLFSFSQNSMSRPVISSLAQAVVKVGLGILLVQRFGLGGVLAASILASVIPLILIGSKLYKNRTLAIRDFRAFVLIGVTSIIIPILFKFSTDSHEIPFFIIGALLTAVVWATFVFTLMKVTARRALELS